MKDLTEIFLIMISHDYYESSPYPVGFAVTEKEAKEAVRRKVELHNKANELQQKLMEKRREFEKITPEPDFEKRLDIPKWKEGLGAHQITDEMRKEREEIIAKKEEITDRNSVVRKKYEEEKRKFILPIFEAAEEEVKKMFGEELFYGYYLSENNPYFYEKLKRI